MIEAGKGSVSSRTANRAGDECFNPLVIEAGKGRDAFEEQYAVGGRFNPLVIEAGKGSALSLKSPNWSPTSFNPLVIEAGKGSCPSMLTAIPSAF